jgi:hypothetical protein
MPRSNICSTIRTAVVTSVCRMFDWSGKEPSRGAHVVIDLIGHRLRGNDEAFIRQQLRPGDIDGKADGRCSIPRRPTTSTSHAGRVKRLALRLAIRLLGQALRLLRRIGQGEDDRARIRSRRVGPGCRPVQWSLLSGKNA